MIFIVIMTQAACIKLVTARCLQETSSVIVLAAPLPSLPAAGAIFPRRRRHLHHLPSHTTDPSPRMQTTPREAAPLGRTPSRPRLPPGPRWRRATWPGAGRFPVPGATGRKRGETQYLSSMVVAVFAANVPRWAAKIMVKCCSAIGCASRCLPNSKLKGLTFHVFPTDENIKRKWVLAMKRLDVNAAGIWEPKKGDVLCSRHFKKSDFDRSTPNIKLKPGVIPSIFDSSYHLKEKRENIHCRKNFTLKTIPVTNHNHKLVGASSCIEEFQSQFICEHSYSVMDSPKKLKHKLDHVISELEDTKESLRNVLEREKHFQKSLMKTIRELKDECLISQETANRLNAFCWECCQESIERDYISWNNILFYLKLALVQLFRKYLSFPSLNIPITKSASFASEAHCVIVVLQRLFLKMCSHEVVIMVLCDLWQLCFYRPELVLGHCCKMLKSEENCARLRSAHEVTVLGTTCFFSTRIVASKEQNIIHFMTWWILLTKHSSCIAYIHLGSNPRCFSYQ